METIKMEDKDGNIKEYEVVVSFYSNKNKKHYLVYTDNKKDEDNSYVYYALSYNPLDPSDFDEIKNNEEWMEIERVITGTLDENCYILKKDGKCLLIDPGSDSDKIITFIC